MKKVHLFGLIILGGALLMAGYYFLTKPETETIARPELQCGVAEMTYYYRPECSWCQRIGQEDTIIKIEELGVEVREINIRTGSVPRFLINNESYVGYRTFEELKELLNC